MEKKSGNFIKFLGTAGARFVMINQLRASGGLWLSSRGVNVLVDPGPGSLIRCKLSRPALDPGTLDGIILTHKHLDHANDINVMIEAMTAGGFNRRGVVACPQDALDDGAVLGYARSLPERVEILRASSRYSIGPFIFHTSMPLIHPAETYGLKFNIGNSTVAVLPDTRYFPGLEDFFKADILVLSVVFLEPRASVDHLSLPDARAVIQALRPKKAVLTHFGMTMLKARPHRLAKELAKTTGTDVVAATDGMALRLT